MTPPPLDPSDQPLATPVEWTLLGVGLLLTIVVAVIMLTFFIKQQRRESSQDSRR
ncbi:MAG: hypothetical protein QF733_00355 [Phycisphaerales bacterium]|jgi:hypothetical protein|nr:hypothetical protein [Phycisphaerales bacterium]